MGTPAFLPMPPRFLGTGFSPCLCCIVGPPMAFLNLLSLFSSELPLWGSHHLAGHLPSFFAPLECQRGKAVSETHLTQGSGNAGVSFTEQNSNNGKSLCTEVPGLFQDISHFYWFSCLGFHCLLSFPLVHPPVPSPTFQDSLCRARQPGLCLCPELPGYEQRAFFSKPGTHGHSVLLYRDSPLYAKNS